MPSHEMNQACSGLRTDKQGCSKQEKRRERFGGSLSRLLLPARLRFLPALSYSLVEGEDIHSIVDSFLSSISAVRKKK